MGAIVSSLLDPSDFGTHGPQNYSFWHNAEFDKMLDQIDFAVDAGKRQALIGRAEDIMEQDPPGPCGLGEYPGCRVQLRERSHSEGLLWYLPCGAVRHVLAGQGVAYGRPISAEELERCSAPFEDTRSNKGQSKS